MPDCPLCQTLQHAAQDPTFIAEFAHSTAFLYWDQDAYPGRTMLVAKNHHEHLHLTPRDEQISIYDDMTRLTHAILSAFGGFRANHMSLGNQAPHLHFHIVPRYPGDLNAGNAPIHSHNERRLTDNEYRAMAEKIRAAF